MMISGSPEVKHKSVMATGESYASKRGLLLKGPMQDNVEPPQKLRKMDNASVMRVPLEYGNISNKPHAHIDLNQALTDRSERMYMANPIYPASKSRTERGFSYSD